MKKLSVLILCLLQFCFLFGCSKELFQRNSYEMFQIIQREKCLKEGNVDLEECYQKVNYDEYQKQRKERLEDDSMIQCQQE